MTKNTDAAKTKAFEKGYGFAVLRAVSELYSESDAEVLAATLTIFQSATQVLAAVDRHFAELGISQGRFVVLLLLRAAEEESATPSELSDLSNVSRAAMTGLLDGLEKSGFVERAAHASDRRALTVSLTASGREFVRKTVPRDQMWLTKKVGAISRRERDELIKAAKKIAEIFGSES